jgi:hypothetical protein
MTLRLASARVAAGPVGLARAAVGIAAFVQGLEALVLLTRIVAPGVARFPYAAIWWNFPSWTVGPLVGAWLFFAISFAVGWRTRSAGFGLAAVMGSCLLLDQQLYSNHLYLLTLGVFLLTLADCGARRSFDARRGRGNPTVPAWPLFLLKVQLTIVYAFAAAAKLNGEYLSGSVLAATVHRSGVLSLPTAWKAPPLFAALAVGSIASELVLAGALWSVRWCKVGLVGAAGFHGLIFMVMTSDVFLGLELAVFAIEMITVYALSSALPLMGARPGRTLLWSPQREGFGGNEPSGWLGRRADPTSALPGGHAQARSPWMRSS